MERWADTRRGVLMLGVTCALGVLGAPALVQAHELKGTLTDGITGIGIANAQVRVLGTNRVTRTDGEGRWRFDLPRGKYEVAFDAMVGGEAHALRLVNQYVPQIKPADGHVLTTYFHDRGVPAREHPVGLPSTSGHAPAGSPPSLPIFTQPGTTSLLNLTVPATIPRRIRVGRRARPTEGCSNNPVVAIEEMDLDEYTRGVLPPEIGVFKNIPGVREVYKTFALAAKSYGLWFMLYYTGSRKRSTSPLPPNNYDWFHIDDTACNQRYSDTRYDITTESADAVLNKILTKKGDPTTLDKYEYAASCGKHGTQPEHQTALVPDSPPISSCVGSWCGHNSCAGHSDNPNLPGSDRCLVRGVCQWGAASWGEAGKDYLWMVDHYQPNLQITDLTGGQVEPMTVTLTGYAYTNAEDIPGSGVAGATVVLSDGQQATSDAQGVFSFPAVPLSAGTVTLTVSAPGYQQATRDKELVAGVTNWASVQLVPGDTPDMGTPPADMGAMPADMGTTPVDMNTTPADMGTTPADMNTTPLPNGQGQLGPLVSESPGIEGGCGCRHTTPGAPAPLALIPLGLGLFAVRRRRA